ncbi:uncharacterized protein LOC110412330 [Herrania umbratica]|uniref:Uncharacterized protein LOC110412330 n=1 Tax=Herrania umbratica TaxID=108875 RepID=A0A6J0ZVD2_9ROSI|nr:uncharacterized protein LOC110412330 [Herrania umbratica]
MHRACDRNERAYLHQFQTQNHHGSAMLEDVRAITTFSLGKFLVIPGLALSFFYTFLYNLPCHKASDLCSPFEVIWSSSPITTDYPTNVSHIKFVLVGSLKTWKQRRAYTEAWWGPNENRGNIFLDSPPSEEFLPWPETSPHFQVNEDATKVAVYPKLANPFEARIFRSVLDSFRLGDNKDVRWFVMADDDTLFFVDNLVEAVISNFLFFFDMAYGGAGYALSYSLVEELAPLMDDCLDRYPFMHTSDYLSFSCLSDLGIGLTVERGMLSSHPQSPIVTLHHFDNIDPLSSSKNRTESMDHLMEAAKVDQSRLAQQTICYHRPKNWSFSVSWGYSAHL